MAVLICRSDDGSHFTMRVTGQPGHDVICVVRPEPAAPPLDVRHHPRHRSRDVLQLFPRSRKGT